MRLQCVTNGEMIPSGPMCRTTGLPRERASASPDCLRLASASGFIVCSFDGETGSLAVPIGVARPPRPIAPDQHYDLREAKSARRLRHANFARTPDLFRLFHTRPRL